MDTTGCDDRDKPGSRWDYLLLAVAMAASLPFIVANIVVFLHRKRRYFRAQGGAMLILTSSIAGLIWIAATFITNMHFPRKHRFLLICPLWSFWLQLTFGFWLWLVCHVLRFLHLHYLCLSASAAWTVSVYSSKYRMLFWALLLWAPGLAFTIVATTKNASQPRSSRDVCAHCPLQGSWKECTYFILPLFLFSILVVLLIYTKSEKDHMMAIEHSRTFDYTLMMVFMIYIIYGAPVLMRIQHKILGRCYLTFSVCCIVFINFWVRLGWPVYLCLFKRKSEMDSFEEELRSCGADCLGELSLITGISRVARRRSFAGQNNDWILRAIDDAMNELSECKERINQLEQKKVMLSTKIEQLEGSTRTELMSSHEVAVIGRALEILYHYKECNLESS